MTVVEAEDTPTFTGSRSDVITDFADFAAGVDYDSLPAQTVDVLKKSILDTIGVALAGAGLGGVEAEAVRAVAEAEGGGGPCTVIGWGGRASAEGASLVFGSLAHLLDYDDFHHGAVTHATSPTLAAALSVANEAGGVTGKELLAALAVGTEITVRLGSALESSPVDHGWLPSLPGVFGAASAAAVLFGGSQQVVRDALGLALHRVGGTAQCAVGTGSSFRGIRDGFAARDGVSVARLAKRGLRGDEGALEGEHGYFHLFFQSRYRRGELTTGLGEKYKIDETAYKMWPCCAYSQFFLTALTDAMRQMEGDDSIREIKLIGNSDLVRAQCEPANERIRPSSPIDAKFSLPYQVGRLVSTGDLRLGDFLASSLQDGKGDAVARTVSWEVDKTLGSDEKFGPGAVELTTQNGQRIRSQADYFFGHPTKPATWPDLIEKFRDCAHFSPHDYNGREIDEIIGTVRELENLDDASSLIALVSPPVMSSGTKRPQVLESQIGTKPQNQGGAQDAAK